jgi:hypothetical protein
MSPHLSALSLPRAGEMPGSAAQTGARIASTHLTLGDRMNSMTDREILE